MEELVLVQNILQEMYTFLQGTDAIEEKQIIEKYIQSTSEPFRFMMLGEDSVGKTTLIEKVFGISIIEENFNKVDIGEEYRYGEIDTSIQIDSLFIRRFINNQNLKGISIIDSPKKDKVGTIEQKEIFDKYVAKADVLFVIFDVSSVNSDYVWSVIEDFSSKQMVFILNNEDSYTEDVLSNSLSRLKKYMKDANIEAPIFSICLNEKSEIRKLKDYITNFIIGNSPQLKRQKDSIFCLREMAGEIINSFNDRKRQYQEDATIMEAIDVDILNFKNESFVSVDKLKKSIKKDIERMIDDYKTDMVERLNPSRIKERFPNGQKDFLDYMNFLNDAYQKKMTMELNLKMQQAVKKYFANLESVYSNSIASIENRKLFLDSQNKFYGMISNQKRNIVSSLKEDLEEGKEIYGSLTSASTELFTTVWEAYGKKEKIVKGARNVGFISGAIVGKMLSCYLMSGGFIPIVGVVIGAAAISHVSRSIAVTKTDSDMTKVVNDALEVFELEISESKNKITQDIFERLDDIFISEFNNVDKLFADYRRNVNMEMLEIPKYEKYIENISRYFIELSVGGSDIV